MNNDRIVFAGDQPAQTISSQLKRGEMRRIARGIYTTDLTTSFEILVRNHWREIASRQFPDAVITDRSIRTAGPIDGYLWLSHAARNRELALPGVMVVARHGAGPQPGDLAMPGGLHLASIPRALAENAVESRASKRRPRRTMDPTELDGWIGMPVAVGLDDRARRRWFDSYLAQSLSADIPELSGVRRLDALTRMFDRLAAQTGQLLNVSAAAKAIDLEARTADNYTQLLTDIFLVRRLPAWGRNLRGRVGKTPKLHLVDSGLAAHMLRLSPTKLAQLDPASLTEFGHLLETFVAGELLKQASWHDEVRDVAHWHTHDDQEVDVVVETFDGSVVGFEVKARAKTTTKDLAGLRLLRELLGSQFRAGYVLTAGELAGQLEDRIYTCPIDRLWHSNRHGTVVPR